MAQTLIVMIVWLELTLPILLQTQLLLMPMCRIALIIIILLKVSQLSQGGAYVYDGKLNVVSGDRLYFKSDTASSLDVIVSFVDAIST